MSEVTERQATCSCGREYVIREGDIEPQTQDCPSPSTVDHPPHLWQQGLGEFAVVVRCPGKMPWNASRSVEPADE